MSTPDAAELQQRVDDLGAALDAACVEMASILAGTYPQGPYAAVSLGVTLRSCEDVLRRHGIRTEPVPASKPSGVR